jgi:acyl-CoA reductase-like NAD-dependent aldehyde dehydrogenase
MPPMTNNQVPVYQAFLAGALRTGTPYVVTCPYDNTPIGEVHRVGPAELEEATQAAVAAFATTRALAGHERATILRKIAATLSERSDEFARIIALEAGKPIKQARVEVTRSIGTFQTAAEEATRFHDEVLHLDSLPGGEKRHAIVRRFPLGPIAAISPFNFPLNLVAHKLAPAIAAGCPVVLKPASQTPISALKLAEVIIEAGWPAQALSVLPMNSSDAAPLVEDDRFTLLTFTGSPTVGWEMKNRAGRKRVTLELGGNAGVIIHADADIALAAARCVVGGFTYSGQSCISVQRIFVHQDVYQQFMDAFLPQVRALKVGHPLEDDTDLGSLISAKDGERVANWIAEASRAGAECLVGGTVEGGVVAPTVVVRAGPELKINNHEIFAPVVTVTPYSDFDEALNAVNNSDFGLQAGVFTRDVGRIYQAYEQLEVGGVMINEVPTWRIDPMPYGGVKQSGFGREGLKYAIEEMTEPKLLVINLS